MISEAVISAISVAVGLAVAKGIEIFKAKKSENREDKQVDGNIKKSEIDQAASMYRDMISGLKTDLANVLAYVRTLETERLNCREENVGLKAEIKALNTRITNLESKTLPIVVAK